MLTLSDFHIHATAYRGRDPLMTVDNIVKAAAEGGLAAVGILEHLSPSRGYPWQPVQRIVEAAEHLQPPDDTDVFLGCEVNILDRAGDMGLSAQDLRQAGLDYTIAAAHALQPTEKTLDAFLDCNIHCIVHAIERNPFIDIIGHPWRDLPKILRATGVPGNWHFGCIPEAYHRMLGQAATEHDVAVEINAGDPLDDPDFSRYVALLAESGSRLAVGSDAHWMKDCGNVRPVFRFLDSLGIDERQIFRPAP